MTGPAESPSEIDWETVARAETHWLRISILELLAIDGGRTMSPKEMAFELREKLAKVVYHTAELHRANLIDLVREHEVGGAIEHFYAVPNLRREQH